MVVNPTCAIDYTRDCIYYDTQNVITYMNVVHTMSVN